MGPDRVDIYWMQHTGEWYPVHHGVTLDEALGLLISDPVLHPQTSDAFQRPAWMRFAFSSSCHHVAGTPISYLGPRSGRPNTFQ
jgi:hypothetical protein